MSVVFRATLEIDSNAKLENVDNSQRGLLHAIYEVFLILCQ